jgi:hypothetical protein
LKQSCYAAPSRLAHASVIAPRIPCIAPRLSPRLLEELTRLDDGKLPIAEINRRLGEYAETLDLKRPSYQRVRELVHELRVLRGRRGPTTLAVLADIAWRARPPTALLDHVSGIGAHLPAEDAGLESPGPRVSDY